MRPQNNYSQIKHIINNIVPNDYNPMINMLMTHKSLLEAHNFKST